MVRPEHLAEAAGFHALAAAGRRPRRPVQAAGAGFLDRALQRFVRLRQLCERIQNNYKGLSAASQGMLADQDNKFDSILATCLRHLWLIQKYDEMVGSFNEPQARAEAIRPTRAGAPPL